MLKFSERRLAVSKQMIGECRKITAIGILHALSDTQEFIEHLLDGGHKVPLIFAKPYSKDSKAITGIEKLGVRVEQLDYETLEGTSILKETIVRELRFSDSPLILIDVGGYFVKPLLELKQEKAQGLPAGVIEVTTFGHNRYVESIDDIPIPLISIARSPLKDIEASFVGESAWFATDKVLREVGVSSFGRHVGIIGYGMIGRRIASVAQANGARTHIFDRDSIKLLDARSFKHEICFSIRDLLQSSEIVICATGEAPLSVDEIKNARDGIVLASAGSKLSEIDVVGIKKESIGVRQISDMITEYHMPWNNSVSVIRGGAAINFLLGSCPDETMDIVFAEIIQGFRMLAERPLSVGKIHEVSNTDRGKIATNWLARQK